MTVTNPRVGLVLGAGGVLGAAWMTGALAAVQDRVGIPLGDVDLIIGTSAGSVLAAALRCGVGVDDIVAHQRGVPPAYLRDHVEVDGGGAMPSRPQMRIGSPRLALTAALSPHRIYPWIGASAWLPRGRGTHDAVHAMVTAMVEHADNGASPRHPGDAGLEYTRDAASPRLGDAGHKHARDGASPRPGDAGDAYVPGTAGPRLGRGGEAHARGGPRPRRAGRQTWIVAMDYRDGKRVAFGREGAPAASLADSVVASCSIPGWYRPAVIGGREYVDGGITSTTSLDLVALADLDEVYVLAPLASFEFDRPHTAFERLERRFRRLVTLGLRREARKVKAGGTSVTILTPGPDDLAAMGANLMDPARRAAVLETSLRTSPSVLAALDHRPDEAA